MTAKQKNGWTEEAKAKMLATRAANKAKLAKGGSPDKTRDAIVYLTHANRAFESLVKPGKEMPGAQLLVQLAIRTLKGEI